MEAMARLVGRETLPTRTGDTAVSTPALAWGSADSARHGEGSVRGLKKLLVASSSPALPACTRRLREILKPEALNWHEAYTQHAWPVGYVLRLHKKVRVGPSLSFKCDDATLGRCYT